ncbi:hypothetical protein WJX77_011212 [Trebouxia sp. C0004]
MQDEQKDLRRDMQDSQKYLRRDMRDSQKDLQNELQQISSFVLAEDLITQKSFFRQCFNCNFTNLFL